MTLARSLKGAAFTAVAAIERTLAPATPEPIQNFLLLQYPSALGTALHATPLVPALHQAVPGCRIEVAASGFALEVFRHNPGVHRLLPTPSPLHDLPGALRALRAHRPFAGAPFAALTTVGNERTRIALAALFGRVPLRFGFTEAPQLFRSTLTLDPHRSLIANNLRLAALFSTQGPPIPHIEPELFPSAEDHAWAQQTLTAAGVRPGQTLAVFVTQTSPTQRKSWRPERFQAVARFLIERHAAHILFVGTAAEAPAIDALRAGIPHPAATTSLAGRTTLPQLAALLARCTVGLTLDTGTMHLGRTANLPMVILAPAWSPVVEWLPVGNPRYRILKHADLPTCPPNYIIDEVSIEAAQTALEDLLTTYPTPPLLLTTDN